MAENDSPNEIVPTRPMTETLLDFGAPLLEQLPSEPPVDALESALQVVITIWNAHVMALEVWGHPEHLSQLTDLAYAKGAPKQLAQTLESLTIRRLQAFSRDPRAVGKWSVAPDEQGGFTFRCDARIPAALGSTR